MFQEPIGCITENMSLGFPLKSARNNLYADETRACDFRFSDRCLSLKQKQNEYPDQLGVGGSGS